MADDTIYVRVEVTHNYVTLYEHIEAMSLDDFKRSERQVSTGIWWPALSEMFHMVRKKLGIEPC